MNRIFLILIVIFISSCGSKDNGTSNPTAEEKEKQKDSLVSEKESEVVLKDQQVLHGLVKRLKLVSLPLKFRLHEGINSEGENMLELPFESEESKLFVKGQVNFIYGMLPDTSSYYAIITFIPGDAMVPILYTYSKSGKLISFESLFVRGCGFDCGILKCTSDCFIDKKLNVSLVDSNHWYTCNDKGEELPNSRKYFYEKKTFKISSTGKIIEVKEWKADIKK